MQTNKTTNNPDQPETINISIPSEFYKNRRNKEELPEEYVNKILTKATSFVFPDTDFGNFFKPRSVDKAQLEPATLEKYTQQATTDTTECDIKNPEVIFHGAFSKASININIPIDQFVQNPNNRQKNTSNLPNIKALQEAYRTLDNDEIKILDQWYDLLKIPAKIRILFEKINDETQVEELTQITENYMMVPRDKQSELCVISEKLRKKASLPVLPENPRKKQMYKPVKGLRGDDLRNHLMKHMEETWGKYLTYFNKELEEDVLYQDYLWRNDEPFMKKFYNKLNRDHQLDSSKPRPKDVIKIKSELVSQEVDGKTSEDAKEYSRRSIAIMRRLGK